MSIGTFKVGDTVFYAVDFHVPSTGDVGDPTDPVARLRDPSGTWTTLTTPAKQDSKDGLYGGTIDTTSYAVGQYCIHVYATVATNVIQAKPLYFSLTTHNIDSIAGSGFNSATDTLEKIRDRLDEALVQVGSPTGYSATSETITAGDDEGGAYTDTASQDDTYRQVGENATTGLDYILTKASTSTTENPVSLEVVGFYNGAAAHVMSVQLWNYQLSTWETKGTMGSRTAEYSYSFPMSGANQNPSTGEMQVRFIHNVTTYNASHYLRLNKVAFFKTAGDAATLAALAAIAAQVNQMTFTNGCVDANAKRWAGTTTTATDPALVLDTAAIKTDLVGDLTLPQTLYNGTNDIGSLLKANNIIISKANLIEVYADPANFTASYSGVIPSGESISIIAREIQGYYNTATAKWRNETATVQVLGVIDDTGWVPDAGFLTTIKTDVYYINISPVATNVPAGVLTIEFTRRGKVYQVNRAIPEIAVGELFRTYLTKDGTDAYDENATIGNFGSIDYFTADDVQSIADAVRGELVGELADIVLLAKIATNKKTISKSGSVWSLTIYDNDGTTPIITKALKNNTGGNIADITATAIAQELASSV